ncbi:MAG: T9SS type A sorting domain-containing protein [Candidatus Cloacimonetes bacterium]|nr:T9SS type A sorting domain-containing protein [Candidatus Cloacimonadota bacterium]
MREFLLLLLIFVISIQLTAAWESISNNANLELMSYEQINASEINLSFHLDGYEVRQITAEGDIKQIFSHPEARNFTEADRTELPVFNCVLAIPFTGELELEIISSELSVLDDVLISQNQSYSGQNQIVQLGEPAIMRGIRLLPVSFSPMRYNDKLRRMYITTNIEIKLTTSGDGGKNCISKSRKLSRSFEPLYQAEVLNYEEMRQREDYQQPTLLIICPDDEDVLEVLDYLVDWKRQKGFEVTVATTTETGETYDEIKDYIQNAYDTWENPPEYICLAGDADGDFTIPPCFENLSGYNAYGDHQYGQLEGDDILMDVHLGRLSYNSIAQLQVLVSKILYYEKSPLMQDTDWFEKALLVGDPTHSGQSTVNTVLTIKEMMLDFPDNWNSDDDFYEVYQAPFPFQMVQAVNQGCLNMFYRGYLGTSGWNPGTETNDFLLPFAVIITCGTGNYYQGDAKSEIFTRMGTITNPKGAIGMVGETTTGNHTCFNNAITLGIASGIFQHDIYTMGGALTMGKFYLWSLYPQNPMNYVDIVSVWNNLMGDPSLELWTGVPGYLAVEYPEEIAIGENWWQVNVHDFDGEPAEGAWVTLSASEPEDFAITRYCDELGEVLIPVADLEEGEYLLTVTKHDFLPYIDTITVVQADQYVDIEEIEYQEISGNGDGFLNPGETFDLDITLMNYGNLPVSGVNASLTCLNEYLTITSPDLEFGDIAAGESVNPAGNFTFTISPAALDGIEPVLQINITDANGHEWEAWTIPSVTGASLWLEGYLIGEDDVLYPGETGDIFCSIINNGSITATDITARIYNLDQYFDIEDNLIYLGDIEPGETINNHSDSFTVTTPDYINPGTQAAFYLEFTNTEGFINTNMTMIPVGIAEVTDPLGPDAFGYWCFDDEDTGYESCPEFDWIEINPAFGGAGEDLNLFSSPGEGALQVIDLPEDFNFIFYNESYQQLTICSNGWVAPGEHYAASFMNWYIPSPQGPSPMIAVFWDDLEISGSVSGVFWQYFTEEHFLVIEWSQAMNEYDDSEVTFEVILYDADNYPTILDVSLIKMQYLVMNNVNAGAYPSNHGQYATVGLENSDSSIGLQYTYNNSYAVTNKPLDGEMALLFTPVFYDDLAFLRIDNVIVLAGDDEFIEAGESVEFNLELQNTGTAAAQNIVLEISTDDPFIEILENTSSLETLSAGQTSLLENEFTFFVPPGTPDYHSFPINVSITSEQYSSIRVLPFISYQPNTLSVDHNEFLLEMEVDQTDSRVFEISNIGDQTVNFYIDCEQTYPPARDISGSIVFCEQNYFVPGETADWTIGIFNDSEDEWIEELCLELPMNVTLNSATNAVGGSGGDMFWDGSTGYGDIIWHGETPMGLGVLRSGEYAYLQINVCVSETIAGNLHIPWTLTGDEYGAEPHTTAGDFLLYSPLNWINLSTSAGTLEPDESTQITINFDAAELNPGLFSALLHINTDSWDTKAIAVDLTAYSNENNEDAIPEFDQLLGNYPNPFNPVTTIEFNLAQAGETTLKIYNIKGQLVCTVLDQYLTSGRHSITWDAADSNSKSVSSGIYFYTLSAEKQNFTRKLLLLK